MRRRARRAELQTASFSVSDKLFSLSGKLFLALGIFTIAAFWALIKPVGTDPDESIHLIHAWCGDAGSSGRCPTSKSDTDLQLVPLRIAKGLECNHKMSRACGKSRYLPAGYLFDASCQNLENAQALIEVEKYGIGTYPRPLKQLQALVIGNDPDSSVIRIRLLSVLIATICIGGALFVVRHGHLKIWIFLILVANPFVLSLIASANPSSWAFSSAIGFGVLILGLRRADLSTARPIARCRVFILAAVLTIIALLSRPDLQVLVVAIGLVLTGFVTWRLILTIRDRRVKCVLTTLSLAVIVAGSIPALSRAEVLFRFPVSSAKSPRTGVTLILSNLVPGLQYVTGSVIGFPDGIYSTALSPWFHLFPVFILYLIELLKVENRPHLQGNLAAIVLAMLLSLAVILSAHQLLGQTFPGLIQPRYFAPVSIVGVATVIRLTKFRTSNRAVSLVSLAWVIGILVGMAHNTLWYVSGINSVADLSSLSSVWKMIISDDQSQRWWQDDIPLRPPVILVLVWAVCWRMAHLGLEILAVDETEKMSRSE